MDFFRSDDRRRLSVTLDAGYVSITPVPIGHLTKTFGLRGRKLVALSVLQPILFLISLINFTCLLWFMYQLDWSLFDSRRWKVLHYDKINRQVPFFKQVTCREPIHTNRSDHSARIDISSEKQIDIYGDQNSIFFDDDQILFNTDSLSLNKRTSVDFANLQSYQFDREVATRVHLRQLNSHYIHNRGMNITATNQLTISNVRRTQFYSQMLVVEANRANRRSVLRFSNVPQSKEKTSPRQQRTPRGNLRVRSDIVFLDLPRLPAFINNYRSGAGMYRLCICNTTFLLLRSFAHQPCPRC